MTTALAWTGNKDGGLDSGDGRWSIYPKVDPATQQVVPDVHQLRPVAAGGPDPIVYEGTLAACKIMADYENHPKFADGVGWRGLDCAECETLDMEVVRRRFGPDRVCYETWRCPDCGDTYVAPPCRYDDDKPEIG